MVEVADSERNLLGNAISNVISSFVLVEITIIEVRDGTDQSTCTTMFQVVTLLRCKSGVGGD